ncbi:hypothetical protein GQ600_26791 [Phytophthora cactorum]|nr:hypothetical protein GQ600_26791 [Phytophthora cactorum]
MTRNDTASARSPRTAKRRHRCEFPGCTTPSRRRGLCFRHGGFTLCSVMGCAKPSSTHGLCFAHGESHLAGIWLLDAKRLPRIVLRSRVSIRDPALQQAS